VVYIYNQAIRLLEKAAEFGIDCDGISIVKFYFFDYDKGGDAGILYVIKLSANKFYGPVEYYQYMLDIMILRIPIGFYRNE